MKVSPGKRPSPSKFPLAPTDLTDGEVLRPFVFARIPCPPYNVIRGNFTLFNMSIGVSVDMQDSGIGQEDCIVNISMSQLL